MKTTVHFFWPATYVPFARSPDEPTAGSTGVKVFKEGILFHMWGFNLVSPKGGRNTEKCGL